MPNATISSRPATSRPLFLLLFLPGRALAPGLAALALVLAPATTGVAAQTHGPLSRIEAFEVERLELGPLTVLYSSDDAQGDAAARRAAARRAVRLFEAAGNFFAERLGRPIPFTVALLGPRDWNRVGAGRHAIPWSSSADRLVLVPVRTDLSVLLQGGQDTVRARRILDVINLHELGHVVAATTLHPPGISDDRPPVRWFDELVASFLAHAYMADRDPALAAFTVKLAEDVVARTEPRFTSLPQLDEYWDGYLTAPHGANTLGWYQNAFNLKAAELHREHGLELIEHIRRRLPWVRYELWTTESALAELEKISPGFLYWAEEMASRARRY